MMDYRPINLKSANWRASDWFRGVHPMECLHCSYRNSSARCRLIIAWPFSS